MISCNKMILLQPRRKLWTLARWEDSPAHFHVRYYFQKQNNFWGYLGILFGYFHFRYYFQKQNFWVIWVFHLGIRRLWEIKKIFWGYLGISHVRHYKIEIWIKIKFQTFKFLCEKGTNCCFLSDTLHDCAEIMLYRSLSLDG